MKNKYKNQKGFGLVEMIIAVVIVGIGIIGTFSMISRFSEQSKIVRDSFTASYLAQEGIEIVKNIRDSNRLNERDWDYGLTSCYAGCEADYDDNVLYSFDSRFFYTNNLTGYYDYVEGGGKTKTYFKRMITLVPTATDEIDVMVTIYWEDKSIMTRSKIYNWGIWNQE